MKEHHEKMMEIYNDPTRHGILSTQPGDHKLDKLPGIPAPTISGSGTRLISGIPDIDITTRDAHIYAQPKFTESEKYRFKVLHELEQLKDPKSDLHKGLANLSRESLTWNPDISKTKDYTGIQKTMYEAGLLDHKPPNHTTGLGYRNVEPGLGILTPADRRKLVIAGQRLPSTNSYLGTHLGGEGTSTPLPPPSFRESEKGGAAAQSGAFHFTSGLPLGRKKPGTPKTAIKKFLTQPA